MKKQTDLKFIKTKVIIDFDNERQAKHFFDLFNNPVGNGRHGLDLLSDFLPPNAGVKGSMAPRNLNTIIPLK